MNCFMERHIEKSDIVINTTKNKDIFKVYSII